MDSTQRIGCTHLATNTRLRVISSNAKSAMGILGVGLVVLDEPGAFDIVGGEMMADALFSGQGKPNSPLKLLIIGTLAPNQVQAGSWYYDLVAAGTKGSVYVRKLQGDPDTWDTWATIRKANPLTAISPQFRHKLLEERDAALGDTRLSARFKSYRLNLPTADESSIRPIWHCQLVREPRQDATLGIDEGLWDVRWSWCRRSTESGWQHRKRDGSGR